MYLKITCLLVEDDAIGIELMLDYIARRKELELIGTAKQLSEVITILDTNPAPSIVFLDLIIPLGEDLDFRYFSLPKETYLIITSAITLAEYKGVIPSCRIKELSKPISFENFSVCVDEIVEEIKSANETL